MPKIQSPLRYFGGKGNLVDKISKYFPPSATYKLYIEPYGGSAAMLLDRPLGHVEIYNDIYENVYSLFKCLSDAELFAQFKHKCDIVLYSAQLRVEYKQKLKEQLSILDRAFYFWYVNRTSHNGIGGWSSHSAIRRKMSKATSDFLSCIDRMQELHDRLSAVIIEKKDAIELINKYNSSDAFIYADPPYHHDTRGATRYVHDYTDEQHEQFIDTVITSNAKILISGYECDAYKRLESSGFRRIDFTVNTVDGNLDAKQKIESLWLNYDYNEV